MKKINTYSEFLILERYDRNIKSVLIDMGITDKDELRKQIHLAKNGNLGNYLIMNGDKFTYGMLNAIFKDAIEAKKRANIKMGIYNILPSIVPLALVPFFPTLAIIGSIFGASRIFHKIFDPIFDYINPQSKYADFLKKMIDFYMKIPEGEIPVKDRFNRAFVVSDKLVEAIKPDILNDFSTLLSSKMEQMDPNEQVPNHFIENELKSYLNNKFNVYPQIPLRQSELSIDSNDIENKQDEIEYI